MSNQFHLFKSHLNKLLVLTSLIICLGADSCSRCGNPLNSEVSTQKVAAQIIPLRGLTLIGADKTIKCKLKQASNSAPIDLAKLQLKITTNSMPASQVSQILYNGVTTDELSGTQVKFDQEVVFTLVTTVATEKVDVTLQVFYEDKTIEGENSSQTFTWEKGINNPAVNVEIVPLSSLALEGADKTIKCKLQKTSDSAPVDLAKLRLKITPVSTPHKSANQVLYNNTPTTELAGTQVELNQEITLTLDIPDLNTLEETTKKLEVILQAIYEGSAIGAPQKFVWQKDIRAELFEKISAHNPDIEKIKQLLQQPIADPNVVDEECGARPCGQTLLEAFLSNTKDESVIKMLLDLPGINVNQKNRLNQKLPLELAISTSQSPATLELLLTHGATVSPGTTILHKAIEKSQTALIKYILDAHGNDMINGVALKNSQDKDGNTPLHIAVIDPFARLINLLLTKGSDRSIRNNAGKTPVELAQEEIAHDSNLFGAFNGTYTDSL